ncbi:MAG TPA: hypothetical protein VLL04_12690 [Rhizomicrobium sp.]|nr:hypothetical protein [Rhizomicrobium sp.]
MAQQTESVTVNADALLGIWKISRPNFVAKEGLFSALKFGPARDVFCHLERKGDDLAMPCLQGGEAAVTFRGDKIHLAQGIALARLVVDGVMQPGPSFTGHAAVKLVGISTEDPGISSGTRLDLSTPPPDTGGLAQLLRDLVAQGIAHIAHDDKVKDSPALRADLGSLQTAVYLGQQDRVGGPGKTDKGFFTVYALEFENGERICGLHRREDGTLDAFGCA